METIRFDFNGTPSSFKRTPQGFLRVQARLSKTGIFNYQDQKEYRSDEEVFRADSLESLKGAPVTDLHPESLINPSNAKDHIIGLTESVERDGPYLKGSLIVFHEDAIKAIESGDRKEISLGYKCELDPTSGTHNGQPYDAVQKNIVINHVALGPKGWGRAGPDCSIKTDSKKTTTGNPMQECINIDGTEISVTPEAIKALFAEKRKQLSELSGRLDAAFQELQNSKDKIVSLEAPKAISERVNARINLIDKCQNIMGQEARLDGLSDEELKLKAIQKRYPDMELKDKDQSYIDGIFATLSNSSENNSLSQTREAIHNDAKNNNTAYDKWLSYSANLWSLPLSGHVRGDR